MRKLFITLLFGILMFSSASSKTVIDKNFHQKYDVKPGASLFLKHGDGNVTITPWDEDVVDIDIVYRATFTGMGRVQPKDFEAEFEKRGDRITVIGREPRVIGIGSHRVDEYRYTIKAPAYVLLDLEGVDGDVSIEQWGNDISMNTVDGNIEMDEVEAQTVNVESVDGDISLTGITADIECKTVDGNIELEGVVDTNCRCKTVDGDVEIDQASGSFDVISVDGDIEMRNITANAISGKTSDGRFALDLLQSDNLDASVRTGDGDVRVRLARGISLTLDVKTGDGRIRTDLSPVSDLTTDDDVFRGSINGGDGRLSIRTGDGSVTIMEE